LERERGGLAGIFTLSKASDSFIATARIRPFHSRLGATSE
jgi:hypothetical protein